MTLNTERKSILTWKKNSRLRLQHVLFSAAFITAPAAALTEIISDTEIGPGDPVNEEYVIKNGATLTGSGSYSGSIVVGTNGSSDTGKLVLKDYSVVNGDIRGSNLSAINIDMSVVNGNVSAFDRADLRLTDSIIYGSISSNLNTNATANNVSANRITAQDSGWSVTNSRFNNTAGTGRYGSAAQLNRSSMSFSGSQIHGAVGVMMYNGALAAPPVRHSLNLDSSQVSSTTGAVFQVGGYDTVSNLYGNFDINLSNGSLAYSDSNILLNVEYHSNAALNLDSSQAEGDVTVDDTSRATVALTNGSALKGNLVNVESLTASSGSRYEMTRSTAIRSLSLSDASIYLGAPGASDFHTLTLGELSGKGDIFMRADIPGQTGDFLDVTGNASGAYVLHVANSGGEPAISDEVLRLVRTGGGNADFSLYGGKVDIGAWQYSLIKNGNEWGLGQTGIPLTPIDPVDPIDPTVPPEPERTTTPSVDALLNIASAAKFIFFSELNSAGQRLNDGRNAKQNGIWGNYRHNSQRISGAWDSAYRLEQNGFILGGDRRRDTEQGALVTGAFLTRSDSKIKNARGGKSRVESWGGGLYAGVSFDSGWYSDATVKFNRYSNDLSATMSDGSGVKGSWSGYGWGGALEGGRHIAFSESAFTLTPYVSLGGYQNQNRAVTLNNGMRAHTGNGASLRLEGGLRTAYSTDVGGRKVTPYLSLAAQQELIKSSSIKINDTWDFDNDFTGTTMRLGGGLNVAITDSADLWFQAAYASGKHNETPVGADIGVRVTF